MFGNNNKKEVSKTSSIIPTSGTNSLNSLVQGTMVEGTVTSDSDIRVDGMIKGKLICKAKVIIGSSGTIEGEVKCRSAVVEGTFNGSIVVDELLNIRESAKISGEISTNKLIVQSGAVFNVACNMGGKKKMDTNGNAQPTLKTVKQDTDKIAGEPKPARVK
jgi:cytoskeletal protein CcmA (bactofilin family)